MNSGGRSAQGAVLLIVSFSLEIICCEVCGFVAIVSILLIMVISSEKSDEERNARNLYLGETL